MPCQACPAWHPTASNALLGPTSRPGATSMHEGKGARESSRQKSNVRSTLPRYLPRYTGAEMWQVAGTSVPVYQCRWSSCMALLGEIKGLSATSRHDSVLLQTLIFFEPPLVFVFIFIHLPLGLSCADRPTADCRCEATRGETRRDGAESVQECCNAAFRAVPPAFKHS